MIGLFFYHFANAELVLASVENEIIDQVSKDHRWHKILGLKDKKLDYIGQDFYLSDTSNFSPKDELIETIKIYINFINDPSQSQKACQLPGRLIFISQLIKDLPKFDAKKCKLFSAWTKNSTIDSVSLLFVSGYFQNPASFFGHTLIKFNSTNNNSFLLDGSLNYGANTSNDAALPYVIKGLFGGYDASLTTEKFFRHSAIYSEFQMRDIWEYKLILTQDQVNLILGHTFEILNKNAQYFFLSDNCAYRMSRIIGMAANTELIPKNLPWSSPIDLLMSLQKKGLLSEPLFQPSVQSRALNSISILTPSNKKIFESIALNKVEINQDAEYPGEVQIALIDFFNYQKLGAYQEGDFVNSKKIDLKRKKVLQSLNSDIKINSRVNSFVRKSPENDSPPTLIRTTFKNVNYINSLSKEFISLRLRGANFEFLDNLGSRSGNSEFIFLSPKITFTKNHLFLDDFILFKITALNDRRAKMPGEFNYSWGVEAGRANLTTSCYPCNVAKISGRLGKSFLITAASTFFNTINFNAHESVRSSGSTSYSYRAGIISRPSKHINIYAEYENIFFQSNQTFNEEITKIKVRYNFANSLSFNLGFSRGKYLDETLLEINKYF